jgi:hypothetical protein
VVVKAERGPLSLYLDIAFEVDLVPTHRVICDFHKDISCVYLDADVHFLRKVQRDVALGELHLGVDLKRPFGLFYLDV